MRLLVVEPGLRLWGSERAFLATVPDLVAANEKVVVLLPSDAELRGPLRDLGVTVVEAPIGNLHRSGRLGRLRAAGAIARACRKHQITKIYLNQAGLCRIVHGISALMGVPLAIHIRLVEDIPRCAELPCSTPVDLIYISKDMRSRHPADRMAGKRLVTAYDPYVLGDAEPNDDEVPRSMFCCVGRLAAIKGQRELVVGLALARARGLTGSLDIIGAAAPGDRYGQKLERQAEALVNSGEVRFLGYRSDIDDLMKRYRFVVVPSRYEPLGRVVMEAWDAGAVPMCSRDAGGCSEIVAASGGGMLYDGHNSDAIADALLKAAALSESDRQGLVRRGRDWGRRNLSLDAYRVALTGVLFPEPPPSDPSLEAADTLQNDNGQVALI